MFCIIRFNEGDIGTNCRPNAPFTGLHRRDLCAAEDCLQLSFGAQKEGYMESFPGVLKLG